MRPITFRGKFGVGIVTVAALFTGCSSSTSSRYDTDLLNTLQPNGSITLARPLPAVTTAMPAQMLGFLPTQPAHAGKWLSVNRSERKISLMEGDNSLQQSEGIGLDNLSPGRFTVVHKQRSPLWYAPDEYFAARSLPVPPAGDSARYLRGALGKYAIFLDATTAFHGAPLSSEQVRGAKLNEQQLAQLYYQLEVGTPVIVQ